MKICACLRGCRNAIPAAGATGRRAAPGACAEWLESKGEQGEEGKESTFAEARESNDASYSGQAQLGRPSHEHVPEFRHEQFGLA